MDYVNKIICGDALSVLKAMPDGVVDMIMTSPPYWGLRDYQAEHLIWDGNENCKHQWRNSSIEHDNLRNRGETSIISNERNKDIHLGKQDSSGQFCRECRAWRGQLGLEPTFDLFIKHLLLITAELKRVLKASGSFYLNMGDTYGGTQGNVGDSGQEDNPKRRRTLEWASNKKVPSRGIMPKCLIGIPSRLANRMIDEQGWTRRNTIIWQKPNAMPDSANDRLTDTYEFIYHFVKNTKPLCWYNTKTSIMTDKPTLIEKGQESVDWEWRIHPVCQGKGCDKKRCINGRIKSSFWSGMDYWYDLNVIREPHIGTDGGPGFGANALQQNRNYEQREHPAGKNPGDYWAICTQGFPDAHFATFPTKLCEKPIKSSCPKKICKQCGKARIRITKPIEEYARLLGRAWNDHGADLVKGNVLRKGHKRVTAEYEIISWSDCGCRAGWTPGIVMDPFAGAGTACVVAKSLGRRYIGIELNPKYVAMAEKRLAMTAEQKELFE